MKHSISYHNLPTKALIGVDELVYNNRDKIYRYLDLLFWWNAKINLFSRDVSRETIIEHIRHSLLLSTLTPFQNSHLIVDTGSGGGLPGIPLAISCPDKKFVLNDIVNKKVMALKQMGRKLSLTNISASNGSIADFQIEHDFLLLSKHAFKINKLYKFTAQSPWSAMVLYKSINFDQELEGIEVPLNIEVYKLYPNSDNRSFYKGKGILIIKR